VSPTGNRRRKTPAISVADGILSPSGFTFFAVLALKAMRKRTIPVAKRSHPTIENKETLQ
jgi:hypothetical protein